MTRIFKQGTVTTCTPDDDSLSEAERQHCRKEQLLAMKQEVVPPELHIGSSVYNANNNNKSPLSYSELRRIISKSPEYKAAFESYHKREAERKERLALEFFAAKNNNKAAAVAAAKSNNKDSIIIPELHNASTTEAAQDIINTDISVTKEQNDSSSSPCNSKVLKFYELQNRIVPHCFLDSGDRGSNRGRGGA
jgi:hypothetical protein